MSSVPNQTANVEQKLQHLFDGGDLNVYQTHVLNLGVGAPGPDLLENCCSMFQQATEHRLQYERVANSSLLFQYGPNGGTFEARSAIAKYLSEMYGSEVKSEDLTVTTGASQGFHLLLSTMIDLNGYVFVDEVTYWLAMDCMKEFSSLKLISVRLTDNGTDLEDLESKLKQLKLESHTKVFGCMYYTIPTYHNPTGILFSEGTCQGLIKLARKFDMLIVCDDVYNILHYSDEKAPKRLFSYDDCNDSDYRGNVVSNGSFSKIIGPGMRLGWLEAPRRVKVVLDNSGFANSGGCFNNYTSGIMASLLELGLAQSHIRRMFAAYQERMLATYEVLKKELPAKCRVLPPRGGYFIWIRLPEHIDANQFLKVCLEEEKIFFIPGTRFSLDGKSSNYMRISIAFHNKNRLTDGASRICASLKRYLGE